MALQPLFIRGGGAIECLLTTNFLTRIMYKIIKVGTTHLPLKLEDEELKNLIDSFIGEFESVFSYDQLCNAIKYFALQNNYFKIEPHTEYHNIEITDGDNCRISKYLWQLIWSRKLIINFYASNSMKNDCGFNFMKL